MGLRRPKRITINCPGPKGLFCIIKASINIITVDGHEITKNVSIYWTTPILNAIEQQDVFLAERVPFTDDNY